MSRSSEIYYPIFCRTQYRIAFTFLASIALAAMPIAAVQAQEDTTTTSVTSSNDYSVYGEEIVFTATMEVDDASSSGNVTFYDGQSSIPGCVDMFVKYEPYAATCSTNALGLGAHYIWAKYTGNGTNADSRSPELVQLIADQLISTVAGTGASGYSGDGTMGTSAKLYSPSGTAMDSLGNLYIADTNNHRIRKVTPNGVISTVAGNGWKGDSGDGGGATWASLNAPRGVALDAEDNLYIADTDNHRVRKVTKSTGIISTIAGIGSPGYNHFDGDAAIWASLNFPSGVAVDTEGNVFIADTYNHRIRRVKPTGLINTVAGNGEPGFEDDNSNAVYTSVNFPRGVAVDAAGNFYIADTENHCVRKVKSDGYIGTVAGTCGTAGYSGDGDQPYNATMNSPFGVAVDDDNNVYIADTGNHSIRKVIKSANMMSTIAGAGVAGYYGNSVSASSAKLSSPRGISVDASGRLYVADTGNQRARRIATQALSATQLESNDTRSVEGQRVIFTARVVSGLTGSALAPTGKVAFKDRGTTVSGCGAVMLSNGSALCSSSTLSVGTHTITATYAGDIYNPGSISAGVTQIVEAKTFAEN